MVRNQALPPTDKERQDSTQIKTKAIFAKKRHNVPLKRVQVQLKPFQSFIVLIYSHLIKTLTDDNSLHFKHHKNQLSKKKKKITN